MVDNKFTDIIEFLETIKEDQDSSKRVKEVINSVITLLKEDKELSTQKAVLELEELNSQNVPQYIKTQLWDAMTQLETYNSSN